MMTSAAMSHNISISCIILSVVTCPKIMLDEWMLLKGDETPPGSAPPVFTPPDVPSFMLAPQQVIVTQPTPSVEHGPPIGTKCLLLYTL